MNRRGFLGMLGIGSVAAAYPLTTLAAVSIMQQQRIPATARRSTFSGVDMQIPLMTFTTGSDVTMNTNEFVRQQDGSYILTFRKD